MMDVVSVLGGDLDALRDMPARERVFELERRINEMPTLMNVEELPLRHWIANGVYVREMFIPAGVVLTGYIHKTDHVAIVAAGDISIYDEDGLHRIVGPYTFISKAGIKRAGYAHSDTLIMGAMRMSNPRETSIEALESEFTATTYEEFDKYLEHKSIGDLECSQPQ